MNVAAQAAEEYTQSWNLVVRARAIGRWRNEAAVVVKELGGDRDAVGLARLAVSELLSNVVKHVGDPRCELRVECAAGFVRLQVRDRSMAVPAITVPDWAAESGRGLWLLQTVAPNWGYICFPGGKSVWVRFPLRASRQEAAT